jgi:hypothetical protein
MPTCSDYEWIQGVDVNDDPSHSGRSSVLLTDVRIRLEDGFSVTVYTPQEQIPTELNSMFP